MIEEREKNLVLEEFKKWHSTKKLIILISLIIVVMIYEIIKAKYLIQYTMIEDFDFYLNICSCFSDFGMVLKIICLFLTSVLFSGERERGMLPVLMTTKNRKNKMIIPKILIVIFLAIIEICIYILFVSLIVYIAYGGDYNWPLIGEYAEEIMEVSNITTLGEMIMYQIISEFLGVLLLLLICLLFSKLMKKSVHCFVLMIVLCFVLALFPRGIPIISVLMDLTPFVMGWRVSSYTSLLEIGGFTINWLIIAYVIYILVGCILIKEISKDTMRI